MDKDQLIERLWCDAARQAGEDAIETLHVFARLVAEECAKVADSHTYDEPGNRSDFVAQEIRAKFGGQ